jgi:hypothetical protein
MQLDARLERAGWARGKLFDTRAKVRRSPMLGWLAGTLLGDLGIDRDAWQREKKALIENSTFSEIAICAQSIKETLRSTKIRLSQVEECRTERNNPYSTVQTLDITPISDLDPRRAVESMVTRLKTGKA